MYAIDVYSSDDPSLILEQTFLDDRQQEIEEQIDKFNDLTIAEDRRNDDGSYSTFNLTLAPLNVTYEPYEGDNINRVLSKIANCSTGTIVLIVIRIQTPSEDQKNAFTRMMREYTSQREFLVNGLGQQIERCSIETILEEERVRLLAPAPPNAPPFPFVDEETLYMVGVTISGSAVGILLLCGCAGHMILAAFRQAADLIPYFVSGPMSRKGFLLGGIGTFWHVMVWALAMIADLMMMNMIHRDLQYTSWVYWRFGFGTMVFGFVMFSGTSVWHIVSDEV